MFPSTNDEKLIFATTPIFYQGHIEGTGFFYDSGKKKYLVTAAHVIAGIGENRPLNSQFTFEIHYQPTGVISFIFEKRIVLFPAGDIDLAAIYLD